DITLTYTPAASGTLMLPTQFDILTPGGLANQPLNVKVYDTLGIAHVLEAAYVCRSRTDNTWDFVVTSMTGDVELVDRRIENIAFLADGSFGGITGATPDEQAIRVKFAHDPSNTRSIALDFGAIGATDGLTQFGGPSLISRVDQDGYAAGWLSDVSVTRDGVLMGVFSNDVRMPLASLKLATFQNPSGLSAIGNTFYVASGNSGNAVATSALAGGAGAIHGSSLEKSNVDVAEQFVNLIQAQNGYQANARTIKVTNEMLRELTNLIR
ncbi:MAG: flagellar hook-basal body complex protein, partial [Planctomycetes bacterium]|nr:flagellar hook-basal body complex protein [Planctomycetota bacterium]